MRFHIIAAIAALFAAPALAAPPPPPAGATAQPADPARLALATRIADVLWPNGTYGRMMQEMMGGENGMMDAMFGMRPVDLVGEDVLRKDSKDGKLPPEATQTMAEAIRAKDPHFEERMKISMRVMGEVMGKMFAPLEPGLRKGLARAYARRFTTEQLTDIAAFVATPSGKVFAAESMMLFTDKELMTEMMRGMPQIMKGMPDVMKRVEKATAHLPPPPRDKAGEEEKEGSDSVS